MIDRCSALSPDASDSLDPSGARPALPEFEPALRALLSGVDRLKPQNLRPCFSAASHLDRQPLIGWRQQIVRFLRIALSLKQMSPPQLDGQLYPLIYHPEFSTEMR